MTARLALPPRVFRRDALKRELAVADVHASSSWCLVRWMSGNGDADDDQKRETNHGNNPGVFLREFNRSPLQCSKGRARLPVLLL